MYKIFVIEDDNVISGEIQSHLQKWGYEVKVTDDFSDIMSQFSKYAPQLVLMDIMLPFYNGYYWCNEIRKVSKVPIIFLSSAGDNMNIVMAMNMGGDDFITKPFDLEVLSAKVQAMLRRSYAFQNQTSLLEHKGVILNISDASLWYQDKKVELTKNEFKILQILFENMGNTVSREQIMKRLWDNECFVDDNTLTVNMTRMRKKLEEIGIINLVQTKKGMGYKIGE